MPPFKARTASASAAVLLAGLVAGCSSYQEQGAPHVLSAVTPTEQFAVQVTSVPDEILLAPHGALSPAQSAALGELSSRWRETGDSPIVIQASGGSGAGTAQAAARALQAFGVPSDAVQVQPPADAAAPPVPVRVGFTRLAALGPDCKDFWGELSRTGQNLTHPGFGCAMTANFAAQIADPRDLTRPQTMTASDAGRRATVMDKYRKGQPTASERADDERGVVSRTIQ